MKIIVVATLPRKRLVIRGQPLLGEESFKGFLLRLAGINRLHGLRAAMRESRIAADFSACNFSELSTYTGAESAALEDLWLSSANRGAAEFRSGPVHPTVLDLVHPKVCVRCLRQRMVAQRMWDVRVILACPEHRILLLDRCPACGVRLDWFRPALDRCQCGKCLTEAASVAAPSEILVIAAWLYGLETGASIGATPLGTLDAGARAVWFFGTCSSASRWRPLYVSKPPVSVMVDLIRAAAPIVADWPRGLSDWLAARQAPRVGTASIHVDFGPMLRRMRASLRGREFEALFEEVRGWLARRWPGVIKSWSFFRSAEGPRSVLTATEIAHELGSRTATVANMISHGDLRGICRPMGKRRQWLVESADIRSLATRRASAMSTAGASEVMGVSTFQVEALRSRGLLAGERWADGKWRYDTTAIETLFLRLSRCVAPGKYGVHERDVLLADIPSLHCAKLVDVVAAVFSGKIEPRFSGHTGPLFLRFAIPRIDMRNVSRADKKIGITTGEAAALLKLAPRMIPVLAAAGCLGSIETQGHHITKFGITLASVYDFRKRFCVTRDIASRYGTNTRTILKLLLDAGVRPVISSDSGSGISAVWRKSDIQDRDLDRLFEKIRKRVHGPQADTST